MADQLKRLANGIAYQTTGTGLTKTSNTGGFLSGGKIATIYTAPAGVTTLVRNIFISVWNGSNAPDANATFYYRFNSTIEWNWASYTSSQIASGGTANNYDNGVYLIDPGNTIQMMILPAVAAQPPTENAADTTAMLENFAAVFYGIEVT